MVGLRPLPRSTGLQVDDTPSVTAEEGSPELGPPGRACWPAETAGTTAVETDERRRSSPDVIERLQLVERGRITTVETAPSPSLPCGSLDATGAFTLDTATNSSWRSPGCSNEVVDRRRRGSGPGPPRPPNRRRPCGPAGGAPTRPAGGAAPRQFRLRAAETAGNRSRHARTGCRVAAGISHRRRWQRAWAAGPASSSNPSTTATELRTTGPPAAGTSTGTGRQFATAAIPVPGQITVSARAAATPTPPEPKIATPRTAPVPREPGTPRSRGSVTRPREHRWPAPSPKPRRSCG